MELYAVYNSPLGRPQASRTSTRREASRARETQRRRDRQDRRSELKIGPSQSPTVSLGHSDRFVDRETCKDGGTECDSSIPDGTHISALRPQQDRHLQERIMYGDPLDRHGEPVQSLSLSDSYQAQARTVVTDTITTDKTNDLEVDDFADLFGPDTPQPRPPREPIDTRPVQYGSAHHLPFNLNLHAPRPVQPANRREPIRFVNSWTPHEPDIDGPLSGNGAQSPPSPSAKRSEASRRPINTYKGKDPIKRRVQNNLLRCILADKPLPRIRKKADRMVLKCAGRREFR